MRVLATFFVLAVSSAVALLTPLEIDNHPCQPAKLKGQVRYLCTSAGVVECQTGWNNTGDADVDDMDPCSIPVCDPACGHGECRAPDTCACEVGWEGLDCNTCITLPGCVHGACDTMGLECKCTDDTQYTGGLCDTPICTNPCMNGGVCSAPNTCTCASGWEGSTCDKCIDLEGCEHGSCIDANGDNIPHSCNCNEGYTGALCNEPDCNPACEPDKGRCVIGKDANGADEPHCACNLGWKGNDCNLCVTYPSCADQSGSCVNPFECDCTTGNTAFPCDVHNK